MLEIDDTLHYVDPLSASELAARFRESTYAHYANVNSLVKNGVAVLAALTLMHVLQDARPANSELTCLRLILWFASAMLAFVTFVTWSRGSLVSNGRQNTRDYLLPMMVGFFELVMFLALDPQIVEQPRYIFSAWLWFVVFHTFFAFLLVLNRYRQMDPETDFAPSLWKLAEEYKRWMRVDMYGAGIVAIVSVAIAIVGSRKDIGDSIDYIVVFAIIIFVLVGLVTIKVMQATKKQASRVNRFILNG